MTARFSIGIDLGTTNSALAYVPLAGDEPPRALAIPQWGTSATLVEAPTLPSFLYLPEDALAAQRRGRATGTRGWIAGRLARRRAGETPGRVARSAKSWLCHHTADRSAPILPWGSEDLLPRRRFRPSAPPRSSWTICGAPGPPTSPDPAARSMTRRSPSRFPPPSTPPLSD